MGRRGGDGMRGGLELRGVRKVGDESCIRRGYMEEKAIQTPNEQ